MTPATHIFAIQVEQTLTIKRSIAKCSARFWKRPNLKNVSNFKLVLVTSGPNWTLRKTPHNRLDMFFLCLTTTPALFSEWSLFSHQTKLFCLLKLIHRPFWPHSADSLHLVCRNKHSDKEFQLLNDRHDVNDALHSTPFYYVGLCRVRVSLTDIVARH